MSGFVHFELAAEEKKEGPRGAASVLSLLSFFSFAIFSVFFFSFSLLISLLLFFETLPGVDQGGCAVVTAGWSDRVGLCRRRAGGRAIIESQLYLRAGNPVGTLRTNTDRLVSDFRRRRRRARNRPDARARLEFGAAAAARDRLAAGESAEGIERSRGNGKRKEGTDSLGENFDSITPIESRKSRSTLLRRARRLKTEIFFIEFVHREIST